MIAKFIAAASLAACAASSYAAEPASSQPADSSKFYAGIDVGTTRFEHDRTQASYGAFLGYQLTPNFALEGGYRSLYHTEMWGQKNSSDQLALSVIGSYPINTDFSVYGRLGVNRITEKTRYQGWEYTTEDTRVLPGLGVSYKLAKDVSARLEVQKLGSTTSNISAGVSYSF
jgi:OOP family OmpA-OmpF porin